MQHNIFNDNFFCFVLMCIFTCNPSVFKIWQNQQPNRQQECSRASTIPTTTATCSSITITQEYETNHIYEPFDHSISFTVDTQFDVNRWSVKESITNISQSHTHTQNSILICAQSAQSHTHSFFRWQMNF